ncbi:MAG TPA: sigma-54 dependent transcriptional regulator [Thermoanaerobaculia bacterium]|nr:sigma-54 dependent transcriptional regulator [Thermoanaerobaculia bacterium]
MPRVLIIDDDASVRDAIRMILEYDGYETASARDAASGLAELEARRPDAVLLDIKMPGMDGMEALDRIQEMESPPPVLMISGHGDIATAVDCTKRGAIDFLEKPLQRERLLISVANALSRRRLERENVSLKKRIAMEDVFVGVSPAVRRLREQVARAAPSDATVLITGESGTGKELIAREIQRLSKLASGPFVTVNCAAIPEELIESELFGHEKGSFTGAVRRQIGKFVEADGGTIFLDEIGDMSARAQAKVLRVLQEGEVEPVGQSKTQRVRVRVIAATNKDLTGEIRAGKFREDLYFRLNVVPIAVPPLRERTEDVPALVEHFTALYAERNGTRPRKFDAEAIEVLSKRTWPGNVRELKNLVERVLIMTETDTVGASDLPPDARFSARDLAEQGSKIATLADFKEFTEREFLIAKLRENNWNVSKTSEAIQTPRSNLYKKLEHFGLTRDKLPE